MSAESWKLEKDLCRCCHSEGSFHNLAEPRFILGQEEIYAEMLRVALNIDLSPVSGLLCTMTYTICESCILRLRDAANFKRQVLLCEERFKDMYSNVLKALNPDLNPGIEVKQELPATAAIKIELTAIENNDDDDFDFHGDDDDDDDAEDNKPVLQLKQEDAKRKAKAKPAPKPKAKPKAKTKFKAKKAEPVEETEEQRKGAQSDRPKFVLKNEDYKKEGEEYLCTHCDKRYDKVFSLRFHVKTKHYKIPRFFCPYCKKEFMTPAPLTVHKLEEHNIDERFKCKACNAMFNTKIQLRKHKNNFHMLGEKYKCEFCEYESFSFEGMYKHKFKHKTVKDFHCRFCRKSFLRKATLDLHERIHTGDRRKVCKVCGQAFVQKASLNYHMTKYHPEVNF